jgi:hypothetical protein
MFPRTPAALYPPDPRSALAHFTQTFKREQLGLDRCCPQHLWRTHTEGVGTVGQVRVRLWRGAALKSPPSRLHFERGVRFREERERRHPDIHLRSHGTTQSSLFQISFAPNPNQRAAHACGSSSASPKWPICLLISGGGVINCCGSAAETLSLRPILQGPFRAPPRSLTRLLLLLQRTVVLRSRVTSCLPISQQGCVRIGLTPVW